MLRESEYVLYTLIGRGNKHHFGDQVDLEGFAESLLLLSASVIEFHEGAIQLGVLVQLLLLDPFVETRGPAIVVDFVFVILDFDNLQFKLKTKSHLCHVKQPRILNNHLLADAELCFFAHRKGDDGEMRNAVQMITTTRSHAQREE